MASFTDKIMESMKFNEKLNKTRKDLFSNIILEWLVAPTSESAVLTGDMVDRCSETWWTLHSQGTP